MLPKDEVVGERSEHLFLDNNSGFAFVMTLIVVSISAILGATFASVVTFGVRNAAWQRGRVQAFYCAEAGLNKGIVLVRNDKNWSTGGDGSATHNYPGEGVWYYLYDGIADANNTTFGDGTYSVLLRNPIGSAGNVIEIKSEGSIGEGQGSIGYSNRIVQVQLKLKSFAIFGNDSVDIGGNASTDSYNSAQGPYGEDENIGQDGNVGSNGGITLHGSCTIGGEIMGNAGVELPPLDIEDFSANEELDDSITLTDGIYYFTEIDLGSHEELEINGDVTIYCESASFTGQSKITIIEGKLTFYCTGDFESTGNGIINTSQKPEKFILYCTGSDVKLTGGSEFYGAVYAPNGDVDIHGNHTYYGSIIGKTVDATGGPAIHYDEALINVFNLARKVATTSWREGN